ncbi:MAG: 1,4-dihydroxy-2-naphthoate polyprenyltransferase [Actinomycetaceae bacterium]|nr:1,4-dihydroxy-2-naphthoate polyprenyltransferase [Actinomycetaceae bacterium]
MATIDDWLEGARLRTLPAAAAPVLIGVGGAVSLAAFSPLRSILALLVALLLQIGVNFSNDYSDGVRGTDDWRTGPPRLTGGGVVSPRTVLMAALACFALAGALGLILVALSGQWFLLIFGALAVAAAWFYTGGSNPYGYLGVGFSELFVFVFFGLMATVATTWVQIPVAPWWLWTAASGVGLLSVALLFVNNIRDIPTDEVAGKRTLPVRMGDRYARLSYQLLVFIGLGFGVVSLTALPQIVYLTVAIAFLFAFIFVTRPVRQGAAGRDLLAVLRNTGFLTLAYGIVLAVGLALS